jgi:hypothetical protein
MAYKFNVRLRDKNDIIEIASLFILFSKYNLKKKGSLLRPPLSYIQYSIK